MTAMRADALSNTLRGVSRDADFVISTLVAHVANAAAAVGV